MVLGLHPLDVAVIVMSFFAVIAVGVWVSRGVKHKTDFFVGGRKLGSVLQFFLNFGTMTDSNGAPIVVTGVYSREPRGCGFRSNLFSQLRSTGSAQSGAGAHG